MICDSLFVMINYGVQLLNRHSNTIVARFSANQRLRLLAWLLSIAYTEPLLRESCGVVRSSALSRAETALRRAHNATCWSDGFCRVEAESTVPTTTRDYARLLEDAYVDLHRACVGVGTDAAVCLVSNDVRTGDGLRVTEFYRPVCLPAACATDRADHVRIVDPTPAGCVAGECEMLASSLLCPVTRIPAAVDDDVCRSDAKAMRRNTALTSRTDALQRKMTRSCITALFNNDNDDGPCSVSTTIEADILKDYGRFRSERPPELAAYENACRTEGGSPCSLSARFVDRQSESFLTVETDYEIGEWPTCLTPSCADIIDQDRDRMVTRIALDALRDEVDCDNVVGTCDAAVTNLTCRRDDHPYPSQAPSTESSQSPTSLSSPRSANPTFVFSSRPTAAPTVVPTTLASYFPSLSSSILPINSTTTTNTNVTTTNTTSKIIANETTAATTNETTTTALSYTPAPVPSPTAALTGILKNYDDESTLIGRVENMEQNVLNNLTQSLEHSNDEDDSMITTTTATDENETLVTPQDEPGVSTQALDRDDDDDTTTTTDRSEAWPKPNDDPLEASHFAEKDVIDADHDDATNNASPQRVALYTFSIVLLMCLVWPWLPTGSRRGRARNEEGQL